IIPAGEALVAEAGRDPVGAQQRRQQVGLGETATEPAAKDLGGGDRDRRGRAGFTHCIADELEAALDQRALGSTGDREFACLAHDARILPVDDGGAMQIVGHAWRLVQLRNRCEPRYKRSQRHCRRAITRRARRAGALCYCPRDEQSQASRADRAQRATSEETGMKWRIGEVTITKIVEMEVAGGTRFILPQASREAVLPYQWMRPHFMTEEGRLIM